MESYFEGERDGGEWDIWRLVGLALSLVWPLHLVIGLLAVIWSRRVSPPAISANDAITHDLDMVGSPIKHSQ